MNSRLEGVEEGKYSIPELLTARLEGVEEGKYSCP